MIRMATTVTVIPEPLFELFCQIVTIFTNIGAIFWPRLNKRWLHEFFLTILSLTLPFSLTVICFLTVLLTRFLITILIFRRWLCGWLGVLNFWTCDGKYLGLLSLLWLWEVLDGKPLHVRRDGLHLRLDGLGS